MNTAMAERESSEKRATAGKYLTFILGRESYGIEVLKIREIIRLVAITPVPQVPAYVRGVINLRGKIIPVIDLRLRFGLAQAETTERTCIIVVQTKLSSGMPSSMGLIVDGVEEVMNIAQADVEDPPDFGAQLDTDYILGMAKIKEGVKTLLDISRVVSVEVVEKLGRGASQQGVKPGQLAPEPAAL